MILFWSSITLIKFYFIGYLWNKIKLIDLNASFNRFHFFKITYT
jgi:hypothetical protein